MRPRDLTEQRPALAAVLVVVPARDEEAEIAGCLRSIAAAGHRAGLPVVVSVVLHRCTDRTAEEMLAVARTHPGVHWAAMDSMAATLGGARADGVAAGRCHQDLAGRPPATIWLASTDADSRVPPTWLTEQRALADRGLDLVLGTVEPHDDGSAATRLWHAQHRLTERHPAVHGANLGVRLSAYDHAGGFPELDDGEDAGLAHAAREVARLPWTSTDRTRVLTSARRHGRAGQGFAGYLRNLDQTVATAGAPEAADRLRA